MLSAEENKNVSHAKAETRLNSLVRPDQPEIIDVNKVSDAKNLASEPGRSRDLFEL